MVKTGYLPDGHGRGVVAWVDEQTTHVVPVGEITSISIHRQLPNPFVMLTAGMARFEFKGKSAVDAFTELEDHLTGGPEDA